MIRTALRNRRTAIADLFFVLVLLASVVASDAAAGGGDDSKPPALTAAHNSAHFIDVTQADGEFVVEPLIASVQYDEAVARLNTQRIRMILSSPLVGEYCRVHFPAGFYYFDGAAAGREATIESTHRYQSITGDGINATHIRQANLQVPATIRVAHEGCTVENLSIMSKDFDETFVPDWDDHPHHTAIHFMAKAKDTWFAEPQILNVNINTSANHFVVKQYYRPFRTGIRFDGPWLNIYARNIHMQDTLNAIYINQSGLIAGPAKFIDVNVYATSQYEGSKKWNTFFKSEGHFMEQVELIHCTYIGSQFIYMDGSKPSPGTNPVYNMIIDHCYINTLWLPAGEAPENSGIYMKLPPKPGGIDPGYGSPLYSKVIIFTNNTCGGKTPKRGAFFYVEGNLKGLTIVENQFASGGGDKCIYVRATTPIEGQDTAVKDIEIKNNYFNDFRNPITIGGDRHDPSRMEFDHDRPGFSGPEGVYAGTDEDDCWIESVVISGNQTFYLPIIEKNLLTACYLNKCRQVTVTDNAFAKTDGSAFIFRGCEDIIVSENNIWGYKGEARGGVRLIDCSGAIIGSNVIQMFAEGISGSGAENLILSSNVMKQCDVGIRLENVRRASLMGNQLIQSQTPLRLKSVREATLFGNTATEGGPSTLGDEADGIILEANRGLEGISEGNIHK